MRNFPRRWTIVIMVACAAFLIGWDIYAAHTPGATESEVIFYYARRHPLLPFAFGVLVGHFFWSQRPEKPDGSPE